jgi:hypothetical protein
MATAKLARAQGASGAAAATAPALSPPTETVETAFIEAEPVPLTDLQIQAMANVAATMAPTLEPPTEAEIEGVTASVWVMAKKVAALWVINQNRNSWASFQEAGWKKFSDASDSAIMAFTALASHARQMQANTDRREEADGKVHELYVW